MCLNILTHICLLFFFFFEDGFGFYCYCYYTTSSSSSSSSSNVFLRLRLRLLLSHSSIGSLSFLSSDSNGLALLQQQQQQKSSRLMSTTSNNNKNNNNNSGNNLQEALRRRDGLRNSNSSSSKALVPLASVHVPAQSLDAPPMVFLHGLLGAGNNWRTIAADLGKHSLADSYLLDLRNHGSSSHTEENSVALMTQDVRQFILTEIRRPTIVLGHSMVEHQVEKAARCVNDVSKHFVGSQGGDAPGYQLRRPGREVGCGGHGSRQIQRLQRTRRNPSSNDLSGSKERHKPESSRQHVGSSHPSE